MGIATIFGTRIPGEFIIVETLYGVKKMFYLKPTGDLTATRLLPQIKGVDE